MCQNCFKCEVRSVSSLGEIGRFLGTQVRHGALYSFMVGLEIMETYMRANGYVQISSNIRSSSQKRLL